VVVSAPGLGDDIQAIKSGILEIADIHVVSKCDRPDADNTIADLKNMLAMGVALSRNGGWRAPVIPTSSQRGEGVAELLTAIDGHRAALDDGGRMALRRTEINERRMLKAGEEILREEFVRHRNGRMSVLLAELDAGTLSPYSAAKRLIAALHIGEDA
jgi:LAO/AO transport system kinase